MSFSPKRSVSLGLNAFLTASSTEEICEHTSPAVSAENKHHSYDNTNSVHTLKVWAAACTAEVRMVNV